MKDASYTGVWRLPFAQGEEGQPLIEVRESGWRHGLLVAATVFGIWTLVGFFFASQVYLYSLNTTRFVPLWRALVWQMLAVYLLALATFPMLWLARRFRMGRKHWRRSFLVHLFMGFVIAALLTAAHITIDAYFDKIFAQVAFKNFPARVFINIDKNLIIYWLVILTSHALTYHKRYRESELQASRLATQLAEAQLQALKMQLHPHFLFNTLHSISSLLSHDTEAARSMIARLGDFLRLTLENAGAQEVRLREELDFLKCYLDIEAIRFYDRLMVRMEVEPQTLNARVPNLILQPIVENAIRHGVAQRSAHGIVEIRARRIGKMLRLEVRDDGPGLPTEFVGSLRGRRGIGLSNTQSRLRQLYGDDSSLEMTNDARGGLLVSLMLPFHKEDAPQADAA